MSAMVIEKLNMARRYFEQGDLSSTLNEISHVKVLDLSLLKEEIQKHTGNVRFLEENHQIKSRHLVGIFDCPYHPYLSLEYSEIEDVRPSMKIEGAFENIRCVRSLSSTPGLSHEQVVAIFPENFRSIQAQAFHPVYYFVDKFAYRHKKFTRPLLETFVYKDFFSPLVKLQDSQLEKLVSNWVNLHEVSHRTGAMPLPEFLLEKSNRYTAAFEELRADLKTIVYSISVQEPMTAMYVLGERLLAYPLLRDSLNFDAISSVIMWKFLKEEGVFARELTLEAMSISLNKLLSFMENMEKESLAYETYEERKASLRKFIVNYLGNYTVLLNEYRNFWSRA